MLACTSSGEGPGADGSGANRAGSWNDRRMRSCGVSPETSVTGWPGTSSPTASSTTTPPTRGEPRRPTSAANQPPIELPITVTSQTSMSSSRRTYSRARSRIPAMASGRGVPSNPGWVGVSTRARHRAASRSPNPRTEAGPAPPCRSRNGRSRLRSARRSGTPSPSRSTLRCASVGVQRTEEGVTITRSAPSDSRGRHVLSDRLAPRGAGAREDG